MRAVRDAKCRSYWQKTSAAESLFTYINMDFEGLKETVARLIAGEAMEVDVDGFENDFESFGGKDDVLTLLIHLGYLTYHEDDKTVRIPNEEVRTEFDKILKGEGVSAPWLALIRKSQKLLEDTIAGNEDAVAAAIDEIRATEYAPTFYNNELALRYVVNFAYIAAIGQYMKIGICSVDVENQLFFKPVRKRRLVCCHPERREATVKDLFVGSHVAI